MTPADYLEEHIYWLRQMHSDGCISWETKQMGMAIMLLPIIQDKGRLAVPAAATGQDGTLLYCWDKDDHHLEFECKNSDFFYVNRKTNEMWTEEKCLKEPISARLFEVLEIFKI